MENKVKTFFSCYLYQLSNEKGNAVENDILEYVTQAQRINYADPSFKNIKDQLKSRVNTAVIYRVLQSGTIALCIYKKELPSSFKVFCAKDKLAGNKKVVFVDATGLITYQNGMFYCKDIDRLATYLTGALVHNIYYTDAIKLTGNAILQKSTTSAFVKMFSRVMEYLRVNNYLQNKERILYIAGVYFAYSIIGLNIESARKVSAAVNHVNPVDQKMHDYRYIEDDFTNINTFIESITKTFNLVGMNTSVFANKWLYIYGKGTIYALELYPVFISVLMYGYAGTYINNWKAIESVCGKDMVDTANTVFKIGSDMYRLSYGESAIDKSKYYPAKYNAPEGYMKSIDDEDYKNENYNLENELSGFVTLESDENQQQGNNQNQDNENKQPEQNKTEEVKESNEEPGEVNPNELQKQPTTPQQNQQAEKKQEEINQKNPPQPQNNNQPQHEDHVETSAEFVEKIRRKKDELEKQKNPYDPNKISKMGIEFDPYSAGPWRPWEAKNLVDALEDDRPTIKENTAEENKDDLESVKYEIDNDEDNGLPRDNKEVENLTDSFENDNPMNECDDLGDGNEVAKDQIDNHDEIGEPRNSEEVDNLIDQLEDDEKLEK